jgi:hypothetical protein
MSANPPKRNNSERLKEFYKTPAGQEQARQFREKYSGVARPDLRGRTGPKRVSPPVASWEIARRVSSGIGQVEAAKQIGMERSTLRKRAQSLGLGFRAASLCDFGQPFRNGDLVRLRDLCGFTKENFEKHVGLAKFQALAHGDNRLVHPKVARKVLTWRDRVLSQVMTAREQKQFRRERVLRTLLPKLPELNHALLQSLRELRAELQNPDRSSWTVADLCEKVCDNAQAEAKKNTSDYWRVTLRYLWQAELFLQQNIGRLRDTSEQLSTLIYGMMGAPFQASAVAIQNALRSRTSVIPAAEMSGIVLMLTQPPRAKGGAPKKAVPDHIVFGQQVDELRPSFAAAYSIVSGRDKTEWESLLRSKSKWTDNEINCIVNSRTAKAAAIRWVARQKKVSLKTGQNLYSLYSARNSRT